MTQETALPLRRPADEAEATNADARPKKDKWRLDQLRPNPLQSRYFRDLSEGELHELAADIKRRGLRQPVHCLPDGTILAGHQRLKAVMLLGWREVAVVVRYDLARAGSAAAEAFFLDDNAIRRQLGQLERLAVIMRRVQLSPRGAARRGQGEFRDEIAAKMGVTGRHVGRLVKLLGLPPTLRNAYDDQRLTLAEATRCLSLTESQQSMVEQALRDDTDVSSLIASFLNKKSVPRQPANDLSKIRRQILSCGEKLVELVEQTGAEETALLFADDNKELKSIAAAITLLLRNMEGSA